MIRTLRIPLALPSAALVVGCLVLGTHALHRPHHARGLELTGATHGFGVKGVAVTGLYPGRVKSMTVRITNPYTFSIRVKPLTAAVAKKTGKTGCAGLRTNLAVSRASSRTVVIKPHKTVSALLKVTMPRTVADACQGARFTISLRSSAAKA